MPILKKLFGAILFLVLINGGDIRAQAGVYNTLIFSNKTIAIDNFAVKDSAGTDSKMFYTAAFEMTIRTDDELTAVMNEFKSNMESSLAVELTFNTINSNATLLEERVYTSASIEQMTLSSMDATAKSVAKIQVSIKSSAMVLRPGNGTKLLSKIPSKSSIALASGYSFKLGQLPANSISKISALQVGNRAGAVQEFTIEIAGAEAKEWQAWLLSGTKGVVKREEALLILLAPNLKDKLFEINLEGVQIVSYSFSYAGGQQTIPKATIGLQAQAIRITSVK